MSKVFEEEKQYLNYANETLIKEIEFTKKEMKEIPKRYTNVLQGDSFLVENLMSSQATKLKKLELAENSPYFGRIDFLSDGNNELTKVYVGKTNINDNHNNEQVVIDWRTPICSLYYDSDLGSVSYEAPCGTIEGELKLKRQIIIKDKKLIDVLDTSLVSNDELLQPYLSVNADNKMKTIVASIQKEQNQIIRRPISDNIVVQGVAGSGKTSVALHRIAYLVYNLGEQIKSNQFLVIGPNNYFLNYISSILPELETEPVDQQTYIDLVNDALNEKLHLDNSNEMLFNEATIKFKNIFAFKSSLEYKEILNQFMKEYLNHGIVSNGFYIDNEELYGVETIKNILFSGVGSQPNFEGACNYFVKNFKDNIENIYTKLNEKYRKIYIDPQETDTRKEEAIRKSTELNILLKEKGIKLIRDYFKKLKLKPLDIYKLFVANINKYSTSLTEKEILELQKSTLLSLQKKKVSFEDLPALMHINYILCGKNTQYKHIVIDEAQDYGLFHFDVLKETFANSTFSIYGDLAQSIYSYRSIQNWESVVSSIFEGKCEILNLNKSYRTTIEITNNANNVLRQMDLKQAEPVIRHGEQTIFSDYSKDNDYKITKILEWLEKGYKSIAIICKTDKEAINTYKSLKNQGINITHITAKDNEYNGGVFVVTSALSKGLEFDAVMINDASSNVYFKESKTDMHLLYVACTRALHELDVLYNNELCEVFNKENNKTKQVTK